MGCATLDTKMTGSCAAIRKIGGSKKTVYAIPLDDIASYTQDGTSKEITAITLESGKQLSKFTGRKDRNAISWELQIGDNVRNYKHMVDIVLYHSTQLERVAIEQLDQAEDLVWFIPTNASQVEIAGLDINSGPSGDEDGGLNPETGTGGSGVLKNDDTSYRVRQSGEISHLPLLYNKTGGGFAATLADLETLAGTNA